MLYKYSSAHGNTELYDVSFVLNLHLVLIVIAIGLNIAVALLPYLSILEGILFYSALTSLKVFSLERGLVQFLFG